MDALGWLLKSMGLDVSQIDLPEVIATVKTMAEKVAQFETQQTRIENHLIAQGILLREIMTEVKEYDSRNSDAPIERSNGAGGGSRGLTSGGSGGD